MNWIKDKWKRFWKWIIGALIITPVMAATVMGIGGGTEVIELSKKEFIVGGEKVKVGRDIGNFVPEIKLEKWGDETYIRVWSDEIGDDFATEKDGKIVWHNEDKSKEYRFYDVPEENKFEFEIILKEKPKTNVITLKIETKDLVFYYQPELTQEEINEGIIRPENVVGSYAVYHTTKTNYIIGQTNYAAGKAFHIYRPQMEDNNGWKVWGELNIEDGILTVIIPQEFLDKAVYPIYKASGLDFGYRNGDVPGSTTFSNNIDRIEGTHSVGPGEAGTLNNVTYYAKRTFEGGSTNSKGAIYLAADASFIESGSEEIIIFIADWVVSTGFSSSLSDVGYYVVYFSDNDVGGSTIYYYDTGSVASRASAAETYDTFPNPININNSSRKHSIYATYTPSAPSADNPEGDLEVKGGATIKIKGGATLKVKP